MKVYRINVNNIPSMPLAEEYDLLAHDRELISDVADIMSSNIDACSGCPIEHCVGFVENCKRNWQDYLEENLFLGDYIRRGEVMSKEKELLESEGFEDINELARAIAKGFKKIDENNEQIRRVAEAFKQKNYKES